ncbi:MAG: TM2 domain-containing protein [Dehalococcoidales bacterium]|nr:TM2 domain-containing protein [Dehalococcoidales bacterium]
MQTSYIPESISDKLPSMVKIELFKLPPEKQTLFLEEYKRKKKNTGISYVLWLVIGLHYMYLGKVGWQFFYWFTLGGIGIWAFIDIFRMPGMVNNYNRDVAVDVFRDLKMLSS